MINALCKVPWKNAVADGCTERAVPHTQPLTHSPARLHPLKVLVDGDAPNVDHGRHSYSNGITLSALPTAPHGASFPSEL